jgi:hypothetical protein
MKMRTAGAMLGTCAILALAAVGNSAQGASTGHMLRSSTDVATDDVVTGSVKGSEDRSGSIKKPKSVDAPKIGKPATTTTSH